MSRVKLVALLIILSLLGILLGQNRQSLELKFFCPDIAGQDCFYRTPNLPLAAWIAIFFFAGILSSLALQILNQVANDNRFRGEQQTRPNKPKTKASTRKSQFKKTPPKTPSNDLPLSDWEEEASKDWESTNSKKNAPSHKRVRVDRPRQPRQPRQPQTSQPQTPTDSTYSYNFKKTTESKNSETKDSKGSRDNTGDDVYDATYRTVDSPNNSQVASSDANNDEEPWI